MSAAGWYMPDPVRVSPPPTGRWKWVAWLLKRVVDINMQHYPNCGAGELKIIAAILGHREDPDASGAGPAAAAQRPGARGGARLKPPEPRRPSQTPRARPRLQSKIAAGAASRAVSARHHRNQGRPWGFDRPPLVNGTRTCLHRSNRLLKYRFTSHAAETATS